MRVLWLTKGLEVGGIERLLCWSAARRDRSRFDCEAAYVLGWAGTLAPDMAATGVAVHDLAARNDLDLAWLRRLRRLLLTDPFDVIHFHSPYVAGLGRLVVRSLPRRIRPAMVSTEHNVWSDYPAPSLALNAVTFTLDAAHVAVSEAVRRSIAGRLQTHVEVVLHGIPLAETRSYRSGRAEARAELGAADGDVVVVTVANLRSQKGYADLLAAARLVLDRGLPARFVAVGRGPLADELRQRCVDLGLGERFRFLGSREDAVHVLAGCDVFVLASHHEGGPLAVLEALATGLPVVATRVGVVPDVVTDGVEGRLVPTHRPDLLAEAIGELVIDGGRRAAMAAAAFALGEGLDIQQTVRRMEKLYLEVANGRRHRLEQGGRTREKIRGWGEVSRPSPS